MSQYTIRRATEAELAQLPIIETAAAERFRSSPYAYLIDDGAASEGAKLEDVWIAADSGNRPIGFALAHELDDAVHLHELDVLPEHAGHGIGRQLIGALAEWACSRGRRAITLTTFRDIPWNGPYYARLGFRTLDLESLKPGLRAVRAAEAEHGLPINDRICMQLDLTCTEL